MNKGTMLPPTLDGFMKSIQDSEEPPQNTTKLKLPLSQTSKNCRMDRIFISFGGETPRGYDGMEIGNVSQPVTFVKKLDLVDANKYKALKKTYHENLVNLTGIAATQDAVYLTYERTGLSLREIKEHGRFLCDRISVATICREIIHGLIYIHDVLKIRHGDLYCGNVYVNEDGEVHIGDIGSSMMREENQTEASQDVQAVLDIASYLLDIEVCSDKTSMSFYLADHFTKLSSGVPLQELLQHPFLKLSQGSWYLANLGVLYSFGLQRNSWFDHVLASDNGSDTESEEE